MATKPFPTLLVASAATGTVMRSGITVRDLAELCSWVLGYPVFTHELGDKVTTGRVYRSLATQFPKLPTREAAKADWVRAASDAVAAYGETMNVAEGSDERTEHPADSLTRMTGRPEDVIVVETRGTVHDGKGGGVSNG